MRKKLTITIDEDVHAGLYRVVGRRKISGFIESLVRPHVDDVGQDRSIVDMLAMPDGPDYDFGPPRLRGELYRKSELPDATSRSSSSRETSQTSRLPAWRS